MSISDNERHPWPCPVPDQDSEGYWGATARGELLLQRCEDCANVQHYPRLFCTRCHGPRLTWTPASGRGVIYSRTVVRRAPTQALRAEAPYVIAIVELEEGPRVFANVVDSPVDDVVIGKTVTVGFRDQGGVSVPVFRLSSETLPT
ncbi:Zn-ribbon domain-containing OB-fold protein [Mycobacterium paraffinicum]|uniref:Zn-ribbon domain-containing OB-fold protein n=1 Tax=Mycobacterium paraffinicum TaxID=53378 RepID=UPI000A048267|nr:OB-fold domain-containing protein [Mycobacterium paraffinicum]